MVTHSKIHEQAFSYFLAEAQDLLQSLEQDLLSLRQKRSPAKVHNLMRSAHTLKGAAASVGFNSMKTIAHSLEDVVKAFYKPEVEIDAELEALLFEAYECLRSPIAAVLAGAESNDQELLARSQTVFDKLHHKLGKHFDPGAAIPTSAELGFDIIRSLFETGVRERLEQLAIALEQGNPQQITETLTSHAEVFTGLAESLNLPGFGAIAKATATGLKVNPDQVVEIAQAALADWRQGQIAVLSGDRTQGGTVSEALKRLGKRSTPSTPDAKTTHSWRKLLRFLNRPVQPVQPSSVVEPEPEFDPASVQSALETLATTFSTHHEPSNLTEDGFELWDSALPDSPPDDAIALPAPEPIAEPTTAPEREGNGTGRMVRVDLDHLESLNYTTSELLIHQNQQTLQDERLHIIVQELLEGLKQHQQTLLSLRDVADRALLEQSATHHRNRSHSGWKAQFDSLELDRHDEIRESVQSALEELVPLEMSMEALDSLIREAGLTRSKQGRLLNNLRDDLITVRMMPIGTVLQRIPRVVAQLTQQYGKQVELRLSGSRVLVDKAIAEKLYDPLLHLVRNAFDHGIEAPAIRQQRGKAEIGCIEIQAYQQGNRTLIEVQDDGRGLDRQRICRRGFELGLIPSDRPEHFSETELFGLLFEPGFSTAEQVSDLSGRGVGLDVVRSQLRSCGGSLAIASTPNQGTTFSLQLPLTLMSARLLVCQAGNTVYGLLSDEVEKILMPSTDSINLVSSKRVLHWQQNGEDHPVPLYPLSQLMQYTTPLSSGNRELQSSGLKSTAETVPILLLRRQSEWIGVEVDRILGEQELVIRPMAETIAPPAYVYGCSVLGDGRLILVIDGVTLVEQGMPTSHLSPAADPPELTLASTPTNRKVLVIDDSITVRQMLALTLAGAGYQVVQAQDGLDAIAQLQKHSDVQFITCDVEMPRLNGFEFLMRHSQETGAAPVVMLTSRSNEKHQQLAQQLGAAGYMTKPFSEEKLLKLAEDMIAKRGG
jgi:chemotaxis protein histidine kinase CheA